MVVRPGQPASLAGAPGEIDASTEVLGTRMKFPILLAPSATHNVLHPQGEHAMYAGATAASGTPMILSYVTSTPFPALVERRKDGGPLWYQLYPREDVPTNQEPLDAAQEAGAKGIVVTLAAGNTGNDLANPTLYGARYANNATPSGARPV